MKKNHILFMLFIGFLSTMALLLGASFMQSYDSVMLVAVLPGIMVGTLCTSGKKTIYPLLAGALLGGLLSEQLIFGGITAVGLYITVLRTIALGVMGVASCYITKRFDIQFNQLHRFRQVPFFLVFVSCNVILYTVIFSLDVFVIEQNFLERFLQRGFSAGIYAGMFGSVIFNSHYHDKSKVNEYSPIELGKRFLFTAVFAAVAIYVFSEDIVLTTYKQMIIVLGMLYITTAFLFAIRMLFVNNIIVLLVYLFLYYPVPEYQTATELYVLALYMIAMTAITAVMNIYYVEHTEQIKQLKTSKENMEKLIISTNNLFNVQDKLPQYRDKFSREYIRDMFRIACNLYPNFDKATCYIRGEDSVQFVDCVGYDLEYLNKLKFDPSVFKWTLLKPQIECETNNENAFPMEGDLEEFNKTYETIKESLRFTVYVGEESYGGMSFDIIEGSDKTFTDIDVEHFTTFQQLMNSYYGLGENKDSEDTMKNHIVLSILDSINLIDQYMGIHSQEVAELASELGIALHLKQEDVKTLYWAGIVHDIGKMGIPKELLNKTESLTKSEYDLVKMHPVFAFKILRQYPTMKKISTLVLHHHEWWDGTGYPNQLKAMAIPYLSQILHVADSVCAMGRDRPFKSRLSYDEIVDQVQAGFGKQFSPKVAREMIKYIKAGKLEELWKHNRK